MNIGVQRFTRLIFYGNYFYGVCAVSLILETSALLKIPFQGYLFHAIAFVATVLFYNYPYARNYSSPATNPRTAWYIANHRRVVKTQIILTLLLIILIAAVLLKHFHEIENMSNPQWFLLLIFPISGAMYYGANVMSARHNLRRIGWLKPFLIGFVWAGLTTIYPLEYHDVLQATHHQTTLLEILLFLKNIMFISMIAILFDIKDYASDSGSKLNTMVVKIGLRKTIFFVVFPLTILGVLTFLSYALVHQFSLLKMILIMIPFFLLIVVARSLKRRRSLMYYLVAIDGLLVVKAVFGILAAMAN
jgi:4-hydroxybenzoate polyprenyltransferase